MQSMNYVGRALTGMICRMKRVRLNRSEMHQVLGTDLDCKQVLFTVELFIS